MAAVTVWRRGDKWVGKFKHQGEQIWIGSHERKADALAEQAKRKEELTDASPQTIAGFAEIWLRDYARPAKSSQRTNRYAINAFVEEYGMKRMAAIDRLEARALAKRVPWANLRVIRAMYNDAINDGLVRANPFSGLRLEQSRGRKDLTALTEEEIVELADTSNAALGESFGLTMRAWILVAGFTGIRPGESFKLEWGDVSKDELIVRGTKTKAAYRQIVIPPPARVALKEMPRRADLPWVFVTKRGHPFSKSSLAYYFKDVRQSFGRPDIDPYDLRHACATNLMRRGVEPWAIAQQLGHSDHGRLVTQLYGHPTDVDSRDRIKRAFGENVRGLGVAKSQQRRAG